MAELRPRQDIANQGILDLVQFLARPGMMMTMFWIGRGADGPIRHKDIMALSHVPRNTLAKRLKELVEAGLMDRHEHDENPPRVEYEPTQKMYDLALVLRSMAAWTNDHDLFEVA